jgi:hypothetical protein
MCKEKNGKDDLHGFGEEKRYRESFTHTRPEPEDSAPTSRNSENDQTQNQQQPTDNQSNNSDQNSE